MFMNFTPFVTRTLIVLFLAPSTLSAEDQPRLASPLIARFSDQCVVAADVAKGGLPEGALIATIAATLLPKVAGGVYNWAVGLITKAAERKQTTRDTSGGDYFYRVRAQATTADVRGCLQLFTLGPKGTTWESLATAPEIGIRVRDTLKLGSYPGPEFFLELVFVESADQQYFRLVPTHLKIANAFSGSKRDTALVVAVTMTAPGAKEPFASDAFKIAGVRPGPVAYPLAALIGVDGKWSAKPAYSAALQARLTPAQAQIQPARSFNPVNISAAVTETQQANALLQSVASALADGQKEVAAAVASASPTEANREAADTAAVDEKNAFAEAMAAASTAIDEEKVAELTRTQAQRALAEAAAGDPEAKAELALAAAEAALKGKQAATIRAKGAANKAAVRAHVAQPYPQIYR
jgi:hypothetical protein